MSTIRTNTLQTLDSSITIPLSDIDAGLSIIQDMQSVSAKFYGVVGDGIVDDTAAIQAAVTAVVNTGGVLHFPKGRYLHGPITVDVRNGGAIVGESKEGCKFLPNADSIVMYNCINSTIGITTLSPFTMSGMTFIGNGKTGNTAIQTTDFAFHTFDNMSFQYMQYNIKALATTSGPLGFSSNLTISNIEQYGYGSFQISSQGTGATGNRVFNVTIDNVHQYSAGVLGWADNWFNMHRVVNCNMSNVVCTAMEGQAQGLYCTGASEGIFLSNVIFVYGTTGITYTADTDTIHPKWVYLNNVGIDQMNTTGIDLDAEYVRWTNVNVTGGALRNNTGYGVQVRPTTGDYTFTGLQVANHKFSGLLIQSGAVHGRVIGGDFELNGQTSGSDIDAVLVRPHECMFYGNYATTVNMNGTSVLNEGTTSEFVSTNRNQVGTDANTALKVLSTYTLPAGSYTGTGTIKLVASGVFAANANTKTATLSFGGVNLATVTGALNGISWKIGVTIYKNGVNAWADIETRAATTSSFSSINLTSIDLANAIVMTVSGQNGTAVANDVLLNHFEVSLTP